MDAFVAQRPVYVCQNAGFICMCVRKLEVRVAVQSTRKKEQQKEHEKHLSTARAISMTSFMSHAYPLNLTPTP